MLKNSTTLEPDAVEKIFCEPFSKLPVEPMDKGMSAIMMQLMMGSMSGNKLKVPKEEKPSVLLIIEGALEHRFTFKIPDPNLRFFLAYVSETAGKAIMYLTYVQYRCKKAGIDSIDWESFGKMFPAGFPTEETLHGIWKSQKVEREGSGGSDNLLDYQTAMKSIQYLPEKSTT